jgi:hypothetical protein
LTLTSIRLLAPHLTVDNYRELVNAALHKTKREVEVLVAARQPKPTVPTVIRKLPAPQQVVAAKTPPSVPTTASSTSAPLMASVELEDGCRYEMWWDFDRGCHIEEENS